MHIHYSHVQAQDLLSQGSWKWNLQLDRNFLDLSYFVLSLSNFCQEVENEFAFGSGAVTTWFYDFGLSRLGFEPSACNANGQTDNAITTAFSFTKIRI